MNTLWWQLKDEYARCRWSEQCHICASERWFSKYGGLLIGGICLLAVSQAGLTEFLCEQWAMIIGRIILCSSLIVTIFSWTSDQQYVAKIHNDAANCYYELAQQYIALMIKIHGKNTELSIVLEEYNRLTAELCRLSSKFPKTSARDYAEAKKRISDGRFIFGTQDTGNILIKCDAKTELDAWFNPELRGDYPID